MKPLMSYTQKELDDFVIPVLKKTKANYHIGPAQGSNPPLRMVEIEESDFQTVCAHLLLTELDRLGGILTTNYPKHENAFIL
jgi:hypothetical protein